MLCRELQKYYEIRIAKHPAYKHFIDQEGYGTFECEGFDSAEVIEKVRRFDFSWLNSELPEHIYKEQVRAIETYRPVAVLGDNSPTLKMAAEKTGVLFLSLMNGYMSKYYAGHRAISRYHPAYRLISWMPEKIKIQATTWGEKKAFKKLHASFSKIRRKENLKPLSSYLDELEGDLTMICDLPELFPQQQLPDNYCFVGPLFYDNGEVSTQNCPAAESEEKNILVLMGSSGDWQHAHFLNDPYYSKFNVTAIGDHKRTLSASHISHIPFAHVHERFPGADLIICHGGNGTIYQALLYKVPLLALTTHCEQEWNIRALEKQHLGFCLDGITDKLTLRSTVEAAIAARRQKTSEEISKAIRQSINALSGQIDKIAAIIDKRQPRFSKGEKKGSGVLHETGAYSKKSTLPVYTS